MHPLSFWPECPEREGFRLLLAPQFDGRLNPVEVVEEFFHCDLSVGAKDVINIPRPEPGPRWHCPQYHILEELHVWLAILAETGDPIAAL